MSDSVKRSEGLSMFAAIAFAVGTMVGAGVFVLSGVVINVAGPAAILSYLFCGVIVTFSALSYAALASIFPEDGGGYLFAKKMIGDYPGFIAGWAMYISLLIATSFVLLGFGIYLNLLLGINLDPRLGALGAIVLLTALNLRGISEAGKLEVAMVVAKVSILILFIIGGVIQIQRTSFEPFLSQGTGGVFKGMTMVFFAYMGFQVISMMGGEIKESSKTVPKATLASIGIVTVIYIGVVIAVLSANLPAYNSESVFDAAVVLLGTHGGFFVALAATISTLSAANANIIGASRVTLEMACEKQIPGRLTRLKNNQPVNSILLGAGITALLIIMGSLDSIVNLTNVAILSTMILVNLSAYMLIKQEKKMPPEKNYFKMPMGTLFPIFGIVSCIVMIVNLPIASVTLGIAALLIGSVIYVVEDTPEGEKVVEEIRDLLGR
ncbi:MAG TPA: amino acid permease [Methanosarcinaceae archaeon]|nr:amino acid permease [Methanosarcinaceae archaeon]